LKVIGMHCKSCETLLRDSLEENGIRVAEVSSANGVLVLKGKSIDEGAVRRIVKGCGYGVEGKIA